MPRGIPPEFPWYPEVMYQYAKPLKMRLILCWEVLNYLKLPKITITWSKESKLLRKVQFCQWKPLSVPFSWNGVIFEWIIHHRKIFVRSRFFSGASIMIKSPRKKIPGWFPCLGSHPNNIVEKKVINFCGSLLRTILASETYTITDLCFLFLFLLTGFVLFGLSC